jgi:hypothetical protein
MWHISLPAELAGTGQVKGLIRCVVNKKGNVSDGELVFMQELQENGERWLEGRGRRRRG